MNKVLESFIDELMITVPAGFEQIRRFRDEEKWISSDSRMSIPGRGYNQAQTIETVSIDAFRIAKYPVTNRLFDVIAGNTVTSGENVLKPKVNISWNDAVLFCNSISKHFGLSEYYIISEDSLEVTCNSESRGFRLPTDAEWQYACKGGLEKYQYGNADDISWHKGNSGGHLHSVGEKKANDFGLFDMLGNVWEWCWSLYDEETYGQYRIFRGGSFGEQARICGATTRRKSHPDFAIDDLGFRLARSV